MDQIVEDFRFLVDNIGKGNMTKDSESIKELKRLDEELLSVFASKNADYSSANIGMFGTHGVLVRLWDKFSRLLNLFGVSIPNYHMVLDSGERSCLSIDGLTDDQKKQIQDIFAQMQKDVVIDMSNIKMKNPNNESIDDNIKDLINYAKIMHLVRSGKWGR